MDAENIEPERYRVRVVVGEAIELQDEAYFEHFNDALEYYHKMCDKYKSDETHVEVNIKDTLADEDKMRWRSLNPDHHDDYTNGTETRGAPVDQYRVCINVAGAVDSLDEEGFAYFDDALEYYYKICDKYQNEDIEVEVIIYDTLADENKMRWRSRNPDGHEDFRDSEKT